jgi:hypothetical protein
VELGSALPADGEALDELLEKLRGALTPELLVVVAVFVPGRLADAAIRHEVSAWV